VECEPVSVTIVLTPQCCKISTSGKYAERVVLMMKLSLCLTKHHAMQMYGGVEVWLHAFLNSAPDGSKWSASHAGRLTPGNH